MTKTEIEQIINGRELKCSCGIGGDRRCDKIHPVDEMSTLAVPLLVKQSPEAQVDFELLLCNLLCPEHRRLASEMGGETFPLAKQLQHVRTLRRQAAEEQERQQQKQAAQAYLAGIIGCPTPAAGEQPSKAKSQVQPPKRLTQQPFKGLNGTVRA